LRRKIAIENNFAFAKTQPNSQRMIGKQFIANSMPFYPTQSAQYFNQNYQSYNNYSQSNQQSTTMYSPMPYGQQYVREECPTLYSQDHEYYNYLNSKNLFENAEYHALKPTQINY